MISPALGSSAWSSNFRFTGTQTEGWQVTSSSCYREWRRAVTEVEMGRPHWQPPSRLATPSQSRLWVTVRVCPDLNFSKHHVMTIIIMMMPVGSEGTRNLSQSNRPLPRQISSDTVTTVTNLKSQAWKNMSLQCLSCSQAERAWAYTHSSSCKTCQ